MAAGATYEPIATTTLASAANAITFSSIPATYTDLRIILIGTGTLGTEYVLNRFNNDTATNYSDTNMNGSGFSAGSIRASNQTAIWTQFAGLSATIPSVYLFDYFSYAGSTNKTMLAQVANDTNGSGQVERYVGLWRSTAAINRIDLLTNTSTFKAGTTATLYGIKAA